MTISPHDLWPLRLVYHQWQGSRRPASASGRAYRIVVIFIGCHYGPAGVHNSLCNLITQPNPAHKLPISKTLSTLCGFSKGSIYIFKVMDRIKV